MLATATSAKVFHEVGGSRTFHREALKHDSIKSG